VTSGSDGSTVNSGAAVLWLRDLLKDLPPEFRRLEPQRSREVAAVPPERFLLLLPASVAAWNALVNTWSSAFFVPSLHKQVRVMAPPSLCVRGVGSHQQRCCPLNNPVAVLIVDHASRYTLRHVVGCGGGKGRCCSLRRTCARCAAGG
jgi:hypothetical protein